MGRGNASGHGTTATRGTKGQKSRSGASGFKRRGLARILRTTPKFKGQKPVREIFIPVNLETLEKNFESGSLVDARALHEKNILKKKFSKIKILGNGSITKSLTVIADGFSESARTAIVKAGGKIIEKNPKS